MSEFIMIAPQGWVLLDTEYYQNNTDLSKGWINNVNITSLLEVATSALLAHGDITEAQTIIDIRYINDELWVHLSE